MNCIEAQRLITPFIDNQLTLEQTKDFMIHIKECPECREELEVYYTLLVAMKQLDDEKVFKTNLHGEFEEHLKKIEEEIWRKKHRWLPQICLAVSLFLIFLIWLFFQMI